MYRDDPNPIFSLKISARSLWSLHTPSYTDGASLFARTAAERGGRGAGGRPRQPVAHDCGEVRPLLSLTHLEHAARRELLEQRRAESKGRRQHAAAAARALAVVGWELVAAAGE